MAGQGTVGLEIMEKLPEAEVVFVPIGGGGLISGVACAIKNMNPNCKVYGVQAAGAPSMKKSIEDGKIEALAEVSTMADGIAVKQPGDLTFAMCQKYVDGIVTVTEGEIASAILLLLEKHKMVAEGAGAVSVAAAMTNKVDIAGKKVVCVVSGGNVDINILDRIIDKGLQENGRLTEFSVTMADKPGQLLQLIQVIAETGANIFEVVHNRIANGVAVSNVVVDVVVETRNEAHSEEMLAALKSKGYAVKL
jgi:threonine dehydratase